MHENVYTIYVDKKDKVIKIMSHCDKERIACQGAMVTLGDKIELIRVRD